MSNDFQQRIEALELALEQERAARTASEMKLRRWATRALVGAAVVVGAGVLGRVGVAHAACASVLPAPLVTFCANEPAKAASINANFKAVTDNIVNKVGALGSTDATMSKAIVPSIVASSSGTGTVTVGSDLTANGSTTVGGSGKTFTVNGTVKLIGANSAVSIGGSATVAPSDGLVLVAFQNSVNCNPTTMTLLVGGVTRAIATASAGCSGIDYPAQNNLFGFVRKGESYQVITSGGAYSLPGGANYIPFGS